MFVIVEGEPGPKGFLVQLVAMPQVEIKAESCLLERGDGEQIGGFWNAAVLHCQVE